MSEHNKDTRIRKFVAQLEALDAGDRARLKRSAGKTIAEAGHNSLALFYKTLPSDVPPYQEQSYFLAATLFPLTGGGGEGNLGNSLRRAVDSSNESSLDRRVERLLDADDEQLPFLMRQAVRYLYSNRVPINWPRLLGDLLYWSHPERFVQRQWARSYFA